MSNALRRLPQPVKPWLYRQPKLYLLGLMMLLGLMAAGCSQGAYPLDFFWEMHYQQSYKSHEPPRLSAPEGAVPWFPPPAPRTSGQHLFQVNCSMCHGATGKGDGQVLITMMEKYNYRPAVTPDLTSAQVKALPDPAIEAFMISGVVVMPSFAKLLSPEERKLIVQYIRTLQR